MSDGDVITAAVEGPTDELILRRIVSEVGGDVGHVYVTDGKQNLFRRLNGFNEAARYAPWLVLVDLNSAECAPRLLADRLPQPAPLITFRVAVRAAEAWLLADSQRLARFLSVSASRIPPDPDDEADPKQTLVNIAASSRSRAIRNDLVPAPRSGRRVGPGYTARLIEFISNEAGGWRPQTASQRSDSLRRCMDALSR